MKAGKVILCWILCMAAGMAMMAQSVVTGPFNKRDIELPDTGDVRVIAYPENAYGYVWSMGWKTPVVFVKDTGWVWVDALLNDGSIRDSIHFYSCLDIGSSFYYQRESYDNCLPIVINCELHMFKLTIFNRWGAEMDVIDDPKGCWDATSSGKQLSEGTYFYVVKWVSMENEAHSRTGSFTLFR